MIFGKHINRYYLKYAGPLFIGLIALIAVDYIQLLVPGLYQMVINGVNHGQVLVNGQMMEFNMDFVLDQICLPLTFIIIAMVVGRFLWRMGFIGSGVKVEADLRNRMFDHAKDLSRQYYQVNKVGNIMSLFTNDLDTIFECYGWGIMMFFDAVFMGVLAILKMMRMNVLLACLALIPMALLLAAATIIGKYMTIKWDARQEAFSRLSDFSQESFSGIAVVKAFVKEGKELIAFQKLNRENEEANIDFTRISVLLRIVVTLFVESVICVILGYGGYLVYKGEFNAGQLVEFIGYFTAIVWPIMAVTELIDMTSRGKASLKRISELLDAEQDVVDRPGVAPLPDVKGAITFHHLNFRYPDGEFDALEDITFTIEPGENVGLVGKTGSGKTTLVDLILRTYNVPDGTLFIDGHDVNTVSIHDVRSACAYVPQDNFLFSDTIENNIAFGVDQHSMEEIVRMADLADVNSNIKEFTDGYATMMGERGVTLSGGQKQPISIARALLKDTPILILDDSVSAVDTQTEKHILENLHETRAGRTTILIAHRISTIERMDKIVFIDEGKLVAVGTHEELYATCPDYRKMVDMQKLEEEGGGLNG
ncbi:MAG: ABC transporter ATP-binding protein [Oscillospiraceae bacterium]|nr:ABC transporter ATP-binding protein [Oscillospiraceae bacterium]